MRNEIINIHTGDPVEILNERVQGLEEVMEHYEEHLFEHNIFNQDCDGEKLNPFPHFERQIRRLYKQIDAYESDMTGTDTFQLPTPIRSAITGVFGWVEARLGRTS